MHILSIGLAALVASAAPSSGAATAQGVEPLAARVDDSDARRFAEVWKASGGKPSAAQLQAGYLAKGGRAIEVFTPGRIGTAQRLAEKIAAKPQLYRDAVERCLPWVEATNAELRATYLGLKGLLPSQPLPEIAVVIGADNSGGTAAEGIQVIGLEVICRLAPTRADFEQTMRQFFAHETVHTIQAKSNEMPSDMLLAFAIHEGVPDYVASLVTGKMLNSMRDAWAREREPWIWQQFLADAAIVKAGTNPTGEMDERAKAAMHRWFGNAGDPPKGWPDELGYWVGMRIAEAYVAASPEPRAAIERLLDASKASEFLNASGYGRSFSARP